MTVGPSAPPEPAILRAGEQAVVDRGGGVRTTYLVGPTLGAEEFLSGVTEFDAGASLPPHWHDCEESVVVLEGVATVQIRDRQLSMAVGDATWLPARCPHRFINRGDGRLRILWTYGRIDATRTLVATGERLPIGPPSNGRRTPRQPKAGGEQARS